MWRVAVGCSGLAGGHTVGVLRDRLAPWGRLLWVGGRVLPGGFGCLWAAMVCVPVGRLVGVCSWLGVVVGVGGVVVLVVC